MNSLTVLRPFSSPAALLDSAPFGFAIFCKAKRRWFCASTIEDAADEFCAWRDGSEYGAREIGGRMEIHRFTSRNRLNSEIIGTLGYNGRVELKVAS